MGKHSTATISTSVNVVPLRTAAPALAPLAMPSKAAQYPELRYMGSKKRLLSWIPNSKGYAQS